MVVDMTTGSPIKRILRFFVPVLLGNLLQQLYSMADSVIVSRFVGVKAFAGVTETGSLNFLIIGFTLGMCMGFAIPISQEFGAGDLAEMRRCFSNSIIISAVFSVILAAVTAVLTPQILHLIGAPEDIFDYSCTYIRIIFIGIPATVFYNLFAGAMRAVGDGRTPLIMLVCSCILNIGLDLLFIIKFNMGVAGAAIATILAQIVSVVLCVMVIFRKDGALRPRKDEWKTDGERVHRLIGNGIPMGLQFSITAIGSVILQTSVNGISEDAVASITAGSKLSSLFTGAYDALSGTVAVFAGQNLGAGKLKRIREGVKDASILGTAYSMCATLILWLFAMPLVGLFVDAGETAVTEMTVHYLRVNSSAYIPLMFVNVLRLAVQGMGHTRVAMIAGATEMAARCAVAMLLVPLFAFDAACLANPAAWVAADIFLFPCYFITLKKARLRHETALLRTAERQKEAEHTV